MELTLCGVLRFPRITLHIFIHLQIEGMLRSPMEQNRCG